ncbi:hypothetical protein MED297_01815 [Reinekea sp. MED297]|uniref:Uncharacterized protein n=1 Tax=Reinekea blandensis MED297 TaxID=314283 RepID=A4BC33_9GAMM|nr:hypothetical protein MED297_01815 [Reinekea sp. MED297] [Reinekea blandensis MED297]
MSDTAFETDDERNESLKTREIQAISKYFDIVLLVVKGDVGRNETTP